MWQLENLMNIQFNGKDYKNKVAAFQWETQQKM